jgi:uncharacterized protein YodC (DUF2158 family)
MAFSAGDVVVLKSGSPTMTVAEASAEAVVCVWFDPEKGEFRTQALPTSVLDNPAGKRDRRDKE